jgi:hypothetical protein
VRAELRLQVLQGSKRSNGRDTKMEIRNYDT